MWKNASFYFCPASFPVWALPPNILGCGRLSLCWRWVGGEALIFLRSPCYGWAVLIISKFHSTLGTYIPACHSLVLPSGAIENKSSLSFAQQPMCYSKKPSFFLQRLSYSRLGAKFEIAPQLYVQPWNSQLLRKLVLWLFFSSIHHCVASQIPQLVFFFFLIT